MRVYELLVVHLKFLFDIKYHDFMEILNFFRILRRSKKPSKYCLNPFFRYFMTVIDHDFKADRKIDQLDMSKWKR